MDWIAWFSKQLQSSAEGFEWAFESVPERLRTDVPIDSKYMGRWPAVRHVWHVTEYERCLALPWMRTWLGGERPADDAWMDNDEAWGATSAVSPKDLIERFWDVRRQELALLSDLQGVDWSAPRETIWGVKPLSWVVSKTYQHTFEHGDTLMRMGLWWEHILEQIALAQAREAQGSSSTA